MKPSQSILILVLLVVSSSLASAQTYGWVDWCVHIPEQVGLTDVHFIGNEEWITGGNGKLYHTTDGGQTFTIQTLPSLAGISNSVFIRSLTEGYAVTSTGSISIFSKPEVLWM